MAGLSLGLDRARADTILWTGGGDGVSWNQVANWSNGVAPTASDTVVISGVGTNVTIRITGSVFVQSVACSASLSVLGGSLSLTSGASHVAGGVTVEGGSALNAAGAGTTLTVDGAVAADGANFYAAGGAVLTLPRLGSYTKPGSGNATWQANGAGSALVFSGLTNVVGEQNCCYALVVQAIAGGQVLLGNVASYEGGTTLLADGGGSTIDLSRLVTSGAWGSVSAANGGTVALPELAASSLGFGWDGASTLNLAALTNLNGGSLSVAGATVTLPNLRQADQASFYVSGGAVLSLPHLASYRKPAPGTVTWQASGAGSTLQFPGLTSVVGELNCCNTLSVQAIAGGRVLLGNVASYEGGTTLLADGGGSTIDLSRLVTSGAWGSVSAANGGAVLVPELAASSLGFASDAASALNLPALTNLNAGSLSVVGATLTLPNLRQADQSSFYVSGGGVLTLPGLRSYQKPSPGPSTWQVTGPGSALVLPALTNLVGDLGCCWWFNVQALSGGHVLLSQVTGFDGRTAVSADGSGSLVDLSTLVNCAASGTLTAANGGTVLVPELATSSLGFAWDAASTLNLAALTNLNGGSLSVAGVTVTLPNLRQADQSSFYVSGGGVLTLPGLRSYQKPSPGPSTWQVTGLGSALVLPALTNLVGDLGCCWWFNVQALAGGQVLLSQVTGFDGRTAVSADGSGSLVDLSALVNCAASGTLTAANGGAVLVPELAASSLGFAWDGASTLNLAALTNLNAGSLSVAGATVTLPNLRQADQSSFYVSGGGLLTLPGLRSYQKPSSGPSTWQVTGPGSALVLPALTNLVGDLGCCWWFNVQALSGGQVLLSQVTGFEGRTAVSADGSGSLVDLSALVNCAASGTLTAANGGTVLVPELATSSLGFAWDGASTLKLAALTDLNGGSLSVAGATVTLPNLRQVDQSSFYVSGGGVLTLPGLRSYQKPSPGPSTWQVTGPGSALVLPALTNLVGDLGCCWWFNVQALSGGQVLLSQVKGFDGRTAVSADGSGSLVNLSTLVNCAAIGTLTAANGGTVLVPELAVSGLGFGWDGASTLNLAALTNLNAGSLSVAGATATLPNLRQADQSSFYVSGGGVLTLPGIGTYQKPGAGVSTWQASGAGSALIFPALTHVVGDLGCCWALNVQAVSGGQVLLRQVRRYEGRVSLVADGGGSVVDASTTVELVFGADSTRNFLAQNGGKIDLRSLKSISGGSGSLVADGAGSLVDLSSLSSFATPLGASELSSRNGGVILLPDLVFLLANVAISIAPGNPVLPPVISAGAAVSLYGRAWRSYWVEVRDERDPSSAWQLWRRVPLTSDLQVIGGPPAWWQAFRVWEFSADPPILDIAPAGAQAAQCVLYGVTNRGYSVQTAGGIEATPASWSPSGLSTGPMTNTFRIFSPFPTTDPRRFFRAKQE